jgi:myo-inositol 2-dehydrogenase / D-chiro-inositol 1-dehydrogenase
VARASRLRDPVMSRPCLQSVHERQQGFPQEMQHFVDCVPDDEQPLETGEDAREMLRMIFAAYESAGTGRKVEWPYEADIEKRPIELWLGH